MSTLKEWMAGHAKAVDDEAQARTHYHDAQGAYEAAQHAYEAARLRLLTTDPDLTDPDLTDPDVQQALRDAAYIAAGKDADARKLRMDRLVLGRLSGAYDDVTECRRLMRVAEAQHAYYRHVLTMAAQGCEAVIKFGGAE